MTDSRTIDLPYGDRQLAATLTGVRFLGEVQCRGNTRPAPDPDAAVRHAIEHPIGLDRALIAPGTRDDTAVIVVSDQFRQTRADWMLPVLLDRLNEAGISDGAVSVLFSTGTHRPPTDGERRAIVGERAYPRLRDRLHIHDPHDRGGHVRVGTTSRGTPVDINRRLVHANHVIVTGTIVLHYFGGFGGGRKSIVPGAASVETIAHNHAMNLHPTENRLDPAVAIGVMDGNPVAEDMLEASRMVAVDGIVNTVLTPDGEVAAVFAGELDAAHRAGCAFARNLYAVPLREAADLVVAASAHTRNFVQTHKALYNAHRATTPAGRVVLAAPCGEGLGGEQFTQWLDLGDPERVIAALRQRSEINGQTALSTLMKGPRSHLVTDLEESDVRRLRGHKHATLQEAVDAALGALRVSGIGTPRVWTLPDAAYVVPQL